MEGCYNLGMRNKGFGKINNEAIKQAKEKLMKYKLGELFCGPGGLALGAINAKTRKGSLEYNVVHGFATDIDLMACKTYSRNIIYRNNPTKQAVNKLPKTVICDDVRKLDIESLPDIDALAFGFPCNDYSIVGERKGINGTYGPLYSYGVNVLDIKNPIWFIAENVGGLHNANEGKAFKVLLEELEQAGDGYTITPHLYKFEEYGVPQKRHRIIIVGIRKREGLKFHVPAPTTPQKHMTAKEAIEKPPIKPDAPNNELTRQSKTVIERLRYIPEGKNAWHEGIPEHLRLNVKGAFLSQIYRRLKADEPAYTLTGSGGGGTHGYHWSENRALTNRERARLQTFPDDFVFSGGKEQVRKQLGMAVPPKAAEHIIKAVLKTLAGTKYKTAKAHWDMEAEEI